MLAPCKNIVKIYYYSSFCFCSSIKLDTVNDQKEFLDNIAKIEHIINPIEWSQKNVNQIILKHGGSRLIKKYKNTWELLTTIYPHEKWPEIPPKIPRNYWEDKENQKKFWLKLQNEKEILNIEEIPKLISIKEIKKLGGSGILSKYKDITSALESVFPDKNWNIHKRKKFPNNYWDLIDNQKIFLEELSKKFEISNLDDWLSVKVEDIKKNGGSGLLSKYSSFYECLENIYPNHFWDISKGKNHPKNYWNNIDNQRKYFEEIRKQLNIHDLEDWRSVNISSHSKLRHIVGKYYSSFFDALKTIYPEYNWEIISNKKGSRVPYNYWSKIENQRKEMENIRKQNNFPIEEWIDKPVSFLRDNGGSGFLDYYPNFIELLRTIYPEFTWDHENRRNYPRNYWNNLDNVKHFFKIFEEKHQITKKEDWYRVSIDQIRNSGGLGLLRKYKSFGNLLSAVFPEDEWEEKKFSRRDKRSEQRWLLIQLRKLLPGIEIVEDFVHTGITRDSGSQIEIDVFIPSHQIGFEYNGKHHYSELTSFGSLEMYKHRDFEKVELCKKLNIELHVIPYLWNGTADDLLNYCKGDKFRALVSLIKE